MTISDSFFKKVEKKTKVNKDTILSLASKIQKSDMKDEEVLRDVVKEISEIAGKEVSKEKEDKIVSAILNDKVPNNLDRMFWHNFTIKKIFIPYIEIYFEI